jgi:hypothetical protein
MVVEGSQSVIGGLAGMASGTLWRIWVLGLRVRLVGVLLRYLIESTTMATTNQATAAGLTTPLLFSTVVHRVGNREIEMNKGDSHEQLR